MTPQRKVFVRRFFIPLVCLSATFLSSCASISVKNVSASDTKITKPPTIVYVTPLSLEGAQIKENPYRKTPGALGSETQKLISGYLVSELVKAGIPAQAATKSATKSGAWIVEGRIIRVAEGNRLLRMGIGLGLGGTKLETHVEIRKADARRPFLAFNTTGGSNATPGAATNPIPFSSAPQALLNAKDGITDDSARTARMITGTISQYLAAHGLEVHPPVATTAGSGASAAHSKAAAAKPAGGGN